MKVLHIVPQSIHVPGFYYLGSTKDILGRVEYFAAHSMDVEQMAVERSDEILLECLKTARMEKYSVVFIELPVYPKSMAYIKRTYPSIKVYCRSINAELYHQFHAFLSQYSHQRRTGNGSWQSLLRSLPALRSVRYRFKQDCQCGRLSDVLFSITDWETKCYWRYLASAKVSTLPYFLPSKYENEIVAHKAEKKNICVSFMGVNVEAGSFSADSLYNFVKLVRTLKDEQPHWMFMITSDLSDIRKHTSIPDRIQLTGFLETPYPLLAQSRAVAILSSYGYGFKTKILESILSGCYVLLPPQLKKRLPDVLKPFCIEVDVRSVDSFKRALSECLKPFPSYNPNASLKEQAFRALDEAFR